MTDIDVYQTPAGIGQYQAGIVMTPESAKALDDQLRACTRAVLREGTDYGVIPGTDGKLHLLKPGAEKLLQWFGFAYTMHCLDVERDDDSRKQGATYRATVVKRLPDGTAADIATCEGYAGYDEDKFYRSAEQAQAKAEANERMWAKKDGRVANPNKWKHLGEYRAPWNTIIKMSQKRALTGAVIDATAAAGLFSQEEEDDATAAVPADDGPTWYEQALEAALTFTDADAGRGLYVEAAQAARDGLCTPRQKDHIQNRITQRAKLLKTATPVDVEDLGRQAAQQAAASERPAAAAPDETPASGPAVAAGPASDQGAKEEAPAEDQPGSASGDQLTGLHIILGGLGFGGSDEDKKRKLKIAETITGRDLGGTSKNLSMTEARKLTDTLDGFRDEETGKPDREALIVFLAHGGQAGDGDA